MCLSLFPRQIRSSIRLILHHWFGASRSYSLCLYCVGELLDRYSCNVSGFLSHPLDMHRLMCDIALNAAKPACRSKFTRHPANFGHETHFLMISARFPVFLVTKRSRISFLRVLSCDSANHVSKTTSVSRSVLPIASLHPCVVSMGQRLVHFDQRSSLLCVGYKLPLFRGYFQ